MGWRKSTFSDPGNCVEAGEDYRTASYSTFDSQCAEVAARPAGIMVRDTADRDGPVLRFTPGAWAAFTAATAGRLS